MTRMTRIFLTFLLLVAVVQAQDVTVQVNKPGAAIPRTLFGLFFEDINFGADGGLYPERVKNRSFEFPNPMMGWKQLDRGDKKGQVYVFDHGSVNDTANSHYLRIKSSGVTNEGFRGIGVQKGAEYRFSIRARRVDGSPVALRVEVEDGNRVVGETQVTGFTNVWKTYMATLHAIDTSTKGHLNLLVQGNGTVDIDLVSLYPKRHVAEPAQWIAQRSGEAAERDEAGIPAFSGRLHRRRQISRTALPVEDNDRRPRRTQAHHQSMEHRIQLASDA